MAKSVVFTNSVNNYPSHEGADVHFPITGEALEEENNTLLQATILAPDEIKQRRYAAFPQAWQERWHHNQGAYDVDAYFGVDPAESPFAKYSSQGWKLHIPFQKGREEEVSRYMYGAGLYFKTESWSSFFNPGKESGSTIYVGSRDAAQVIAEHLSAAFGPVLSDGTLYAVNEDQAPIHIGSGSDVETESDPRITARFDVQKSEYGSMGGNGKYSGYGLPSWINVYGIFSALPVLSEDEKKLQELETQTFVRKPTDNFMEQIEFEPVKEEDFEKLLGAFQEAQSRAEQELIRDFGKDFVLGKDKEWVNKYLQLAPVVADGDVDV